MTKLIICRGISGSGKSTWARNQNAVVVSRDDLRVLLFNGDDQDYYHRPDLRDCESLVTKIEHATIREALRAGNDVISDNTGIQWKFVKAIANIGYAENAEVELKVFDVPLLIALERNATRALLGGRNVPEEVIKKQYNALKSNKNMTLNKPVPPKPYNGTYGKPKSVLVDIDGTLAIMGDRSPYDWRSVGVDTINESVRDVVDALALNGYFIIIMSGRDGSCRAETEMWLDKHLGSYNYNMLLMREAGDQRKDSIVKLELFDAHIRDNYDVAFCLDDRDQVVKMYRDMGLSVFQVNYGDF